MEITRICPFTGNRNTLHIEGLTPAMLAEWRGGALIQEAMPSLSKEEREFLITGITPTMWAHIFGGDE
tara:strand:- start:419 stop:622 length:204 start_codon:yes stop_codon:yes gene_type:complete